MGIPAIFAGIFVIGDDADTAAGNSIMTAKADSDLMCILL
jgi:hypothetical protein